MHVHVITFGCWFVSQTLDSATRKPIESAKIYEVLPAYVDI